MYIYIYLYTLFALSRDKNISKNWVTYRSENYDHGSNKTTLKGYPTGMIHDKPPPSILPPVQVHTHPQVETALATGFFTFATGLVGSISATYDGVVFSRNLRVGHAFVTFVSVVFFFKNTSKPQFSKTKRKERLNKKKRFV